MIGTRSLLLAVFIAVVASPVAAGAAPSWTAQLGIGNGMGWFGGQVERYVQDGHLSGFVGFGACGSEFTHAGVDYTVPAKATYAAGVRGYTGGPRHRGYAELSVSMLSIVSITQGPVVLDVERRYGPGVQLGYQHLATNGFTATVSAGLGYLDEPVDDESVVLMLGVGLGYTWR